MAELVELKVEKMIPELEEMERIGLLSDVEVRKLIQKRKNFEYRLARRTKGKAEIINYVNYEKKLLELLRLRRKQLHMSEKKDSVDNAIAKRCIENLMTLTRTWPRHLDTWAFRIKFAEFLGWKEEVCRAYYAQSKFHAEKVDVWVAWAKYELEWKSNFDGARRILVSGASQHHPKSVQLKRELFRLELLYVEALRKKQKEDNIAGLEEIIAKNRKKILEGAIAEVIYRNAVKTIPEPEMYMQLYQVASKFKFAQVLREKIFKDLCVAFPHAECVYKIRAIRVATGLPDMPLKKKNKKKNKKKTSVEEDIPEEKDGDTEKEDNSEEEGSDAEEEEESDAEEEETDAEENENVEIQEKSDDEESDETMEAIVDDDVKAEPEGVKLDVEVGNSLKLEKEEPASVSHKKMKPVNKLEVIMSIFDAALKNIGGSFANSYVEELLPFLYQCWGLDDMANVIYKKIMEICSSHKQSLSPLHFYIWYLVAKEQSCPQTKQCDILRSGVKQHPKAARLQLELMKCIMQGSEDEEEVLEEFDKIASDVRGKCGLELWEEIARHIKDEENRSTIFTRASDHSNTTIAKGMRIKNLQQIASEKGLPEARKLYQKLNWSPPLSDKLHACMVELELSKETVDVKKVRGIFTTAVQQFGKKHPGLWLAYIQFEKRHGDPVLVGGLVTKAEDELEVNEAQIFRELLMVVRELQGEEKGKSKKRNTLIEESKISEYGDDEDAGPGRQALVKLFDEDLVLTYTTNQKKEGFFSLVRRTRRQIEQGNEEQAEEDGSEWEQVLQMLTGHKVVLSVRQVKTVRSKEQKKKKKSGAPDKTLKYRRMVLSDELQVGDLQGKSDDQLQKVLENSQTLQPEFMKQKKVAPYHLTKYQKKKQRMIEREKTKGAGWFDMKAPEMTEEIQRDLELLKMRSVLDPKRHYKNNDMKVLPKHFHLGTVVESPVDFYSSRIPKKSRKRTLAEEILSNEESLRFQKRKYEEIMVGKQRQRKRPNSENTRDMYKGIKRDNKRHQKRK